MITIKQCLDCKKNFVKPHGECPIRKEVQKGLGIIEDAFLMARNEPDIVIQGNSWTYTCEFECAFRDEQQDE